MKSESSQVKVLNYLFLRVISQIILRSGDCSEEFDDLTGAQKKILLLLSLEGPQKMSEVAKQVAVTMPAATGVVENMVKAGLVARETDSSDRRIIRIDLTPKGREVVNKLNEIHEQRLAEVLDRLPDDKRAELVTAFNRVHELLLEAGDMDAGPKPAGILSRGAESLIRDAGPKCIAFFAALLISITSFTACNRDNHQATLGPKAAAETPRVKLAVVPVEQTTHSEVIRLTGSLAADEDSEVASKGKGVVLSAPVERGDIVRKGDILVKIDPTDAENNLHEGKAVVEELAARLALDPKSGSYNVEEQPEVKSAKSILDWSKTNYDRDQALVSKGTISTSEIDTSRKTYEESLQKYNLTRHLAAQLYRQHQTALAKVATLQQAVADTTITAPFDGRVSSRMVSPGEHVNPGEKVAVLVKTDPLRLVLTIPEHQVGLIKEGQRVEFTVRAFPNQEFSGVVNHVGPSLDRDSRALTIEAKVGNADGRLHPGFFATVKLVVNDTMPALTVPVSAVRREGEVAKVFVVHDGAAWESIVSLGEESGGRIEILKGLKPTDKVVADAATAADGMKVE
ncbi:MAG: efflux RND transporter periplasmic adaptor subunit [Candidatus Sumerlaeaceae bacterium]|nr:efflux RND transporter periplasmic adaptor subunit [Candidatus Sumerlaeaceae bacterium]